MPTWAWILILGVLGVSGYVFYTDQKHKKRLVNQLVAAGASKEDAEKWIADAIALAANTELHFEAKHVATS